MLIGMVLLTASWSTTPVTVFTQDRKPSSIFPTSGEIPGWSRLEEPEEYPGDKLYDLIDGGADLYFEYGFRNAVSGQLVDERKNIVQLDIYEMDDDSAAFGIFSLTHHKSGPQMLEGMEIIEGSDFISFRKKNYFVNIAWISKQDKSLPGMEKIAAYIREKIAPSGKLPALVRQAAGKEEISQLAYFSGNISLSNLYYFDYKDIFRAIDGIHCLYQGSKMFIFRYGSADASSDAASAVMSSLMNSKKFADFGMVYQGFSFKDNKGNHLCCIHHDDFLVVQVSTSGEPAKASNIMQFLDVYFR